MWVTLTLLNRGEKRQLPSEESLLRKLADIKSTLTLNGSQLYHYLLKLGLGYQLQAQLNLSKGVDKAHTHTHTHTHSHFLQVHTHTHTHIFCKCLLQIKTIFRCILSFTVSENDCVLFPVVWEAKWVVINYYSKKESEEKLFPYTVMWYSSTQLPTIISTVSACDWALLLKRRPCVTLIGLKVHFHTRWKWLET